MWTNVFRIGGLNHVTWFQLLPSDCDSGGFTDKNAKIEQRDASTFTVLSSHVQLQNGGFLSTWTNCFVGPWDPSQGLYNPDEKIKLWLFLPGKHSTIAEQAQPAVSKLRVSATGLWSAPGDSEEVAGALSQALRNRIERTLKGLSYIRFGDVFSKGHSFAQSDRRIFPTCEFIFAATEDAIFIHPVISAKRVRLLSGNDLEMVLKRQSAVKFANKLSVVVSPHGMKGRLSGCCPGDLVKHVYSSKGKASGGPLISGIPSSVTQSGWKLRGSSCYAEVTLDFPCVEDEKLPKGNSNSQKKTSRHDVSDKIFPVVVGKGEQKHMPSDHVSLVEKTFIYPSESVLVPLPNTMLARSSLTRFWFRDWASASLLEAGALSDLNSSIPKQSCSSSLNSNGESCTSSFNTTSSDSDCARANKISDIEADADSAVFKESTLRSNNQCGTDGQTVVPPPNNAMYQSVEIPMAPSPSHVNLPHELGDHKWHRKGICTLSAAGMRSKRARPDNEPFSQQQSYKVALTGDEFSSKATGDGVVDHEFKMEVSPVEGNASLVPVNETNNNLAAYWHWDDDDVGVVVDIQALISDFGDFSDLFQHDVLPFGEPPTAAESEAFMFSYSDGGDMIGSPGTSGMDVSEQVILPVMEIPVFEGSNPASSVKEINNINQGPVRDTNPSIMGTCPSVPASREWDNLSKCEALMIFAPEYTAVGTSETGSTSSIFRNPYAPVSKNIATTSGYAYCATPPPLLTDVSDDVINGTKRLREAPARRDSDLLVISRHYIVQNGDDKSVCGQSSQNNKIPSPYKSERNFSPSPDFKSSTNDPSLSKGGSFIESGNLAFSLKSMLATEIECAMLQASMCRTRHKLLSSSTHSVGACNLAAGIILDQMPRETNAFEGKTSNKIEQKKIELVSVRIGDIDGNNSVPIGVWRPAGPPKGIKPSASPITDATATSFVTFEEESFGSHKQQIRVLVDALGLLVQQSTSLVDLSLDTDCGDGIFGWLAFQEQRRRGFSCGPFMVHSGCGGFLSSCHSLDIAGVELPDPLSADVYPASVISLLHADIKLALKSAFGDRNVDGPMAITDWCKGQSQSSDIGMIGDGYSGECSTSEARDSSSSVSVPIGEPISPSHSVTSGPSIFKDGGRFEDSNQRKPNQDTCGLMLPVPAILLGYQDDWLKVSSNLIQLWEKAPFEPYALPKPVNYTVVCPDIDILTSSALDFFQQLGTVYEACNLGTHAPQAVGSQIGLPTGKWSSSGFLLVDCPQSVKKLGGNMSILNSVSEYVMCVSKNWDLDNYCKSLRKVLKSIRLDPSSAGAKEGGGVPCTVIYVVCPFPSYTAVLRTLIECSASIGSVYHSFDKDRRPSIHAQVEKALNLSPVDETTISGTVTLNGFSVSKVVLQIVTLDTVLNLNRPPLTEQITLKEIAFTVYNKARRIQRKVISSDVTRSSSLLSRPQSTMTHIVSPVTGMWKDSAAPQTGSSLPREGGLDGSLRTGTWGVSWQSSRTSDPNCNSMGQVGSASQGESSYLFEPLFILAEAGSTDHGTPLSSSAVPESIRGITADDGCGGHTGHTQTSNSSGNPDVGSNSLDVMDVEVARSSNQKAPTLHCSYGWTEDWRWLVCLWTDSRGELLDSHIFPFGGISSRQDTIGLQHLLVQILQLGCEICTSEASGAKPRDIVISRIGGFYEFECQEWQKAIFAVGGGEIRKWPLQLQQSVLDGNSTSSTGHPLQQQDLSLIQDRTLPSSPNPSLYNVNSKSPSYMKGGMGQTGTRKPLLPGQTLMDSCRGVFHWVRSISLVGVSIDHSLQLILPADTPGPGGNQNCSTVNGGPTTWGCLEGFTPVRSLGSMPSSYVLIPSSMRFLPSMPLQLPMSLTAESPPLAHLLHSKGFAIPLATGFVVSKAVPSVRRDTLRNYAKDEWPSVLSISLVDYYGGQISSHDKTGRSGNANKQSRSPSVELHHNESEMHQILERTAAELHALSWMTVSPAYMERRTALPFHCDMLQRLRRLLHYADKELCQVGKFPTA